MLNLGFRILLIVAALMLCALITFHSQAFAQEDASKDVKGASNSVALPSASTGDAVPAARQIKWHAAAGGGTGGDARATSFHMEGGGYTIDKPLNILFVLGGAVTINRDETPSNLHDYPVPHNNYTSLGTKRKGEEGVIYTKFGIESARNSGIFIFAKGGYAMGREIELAQSNVTNQYYEQSRTDKSYAVYGGGIGYYPKNWRVSFHMEYDNRMGFAGGAGFCW